jgi:hypothetical protein
MPATIAELAPRATAMDEPCHLVVACKQRGRGEVNEVEARSYWI